MGGAVIGAELFTVGEVDRCVVKGQALEAQSDAHPEGCGRAEIAVQLHAGEHKPMPLLFPLTPIFLETP